MHGRPLSGSPAIVDIGTNDVLLGAPAARDRGAHLELRFRGSAA